MRKVRREQGDGGPHRDSTDRRPGYGHHHRVARHCSDLLAATELAAAESSQVSLPAAHDSARREEYREVVGRPGADRFGSVESFF